MSLWLSSGFINWQRLRHYLLFCPGAQRPREWESFLCWSLMGATSQCSRAQGLGSAPQLKPVSAAHQTSVIVKRQKRGTRRGTVLVFLNQEQSMWGSGEFVTCPFCLANVDFIFRVLGLRARSKSGIPWKERKAIGVWDGLRSLVPGAPAWLPRWPRTAGGRSSPDSRCVRALCRRSLSSLLPAVCLAGLRVRVQDKCLLAPVGRDCCQDLPERVLHRWSHETNITWPLRMGPWRANTQPSNP